MFSDIDLIRAQILQVTFFFVEKMSVIKIQ